MSHVSPLEADPASAASGEQDYLVTRRAIAEYDLAKASTRIARGLCLLRLWWYDNLEQSALGDSDSSAPLAAIPTQDRLTD